MHASVWRKCSREIAGRYRRQEIFFFDTMTQTPDLTPMTTTLKLPGRGKKNRARFMMAPIKAFITMPNGATADVNKARAGNLLVLVRGGRYGIYGFNLSETLEGQGARARTILSVVTRFKLLPAGTSSKDALAAQVEQLSQWAGENACDSPVELKEWDRCRHLYGELHTAKKLFDQWRANHLEDAWLLDERLVNWQATFRLAARVLRHELVLPDISTSGTSAKLWELLDELPSPDSIGWTYEKKLVFHELLSPVLESLPEGFRDFALLVKKHLNVTEVTAERAAELLMTSHFENIETLTTKLLDMMPRHHLTERQRILDEFFFYAGDLNDRRSRLKNDPTVRYAGALPMCVPLSELFIDSANKTVLAHLLKAGGFEQLGDG